MSDKKLTAAEQIEQLEKSKEPLFKQLGRYRSEEYLTDGSPLTGEENMILRKIISNYKAPLLESKLSSIRKDIQRLRSRAEIEKTVQDMTPEDMEKIFPGGKSNTLARLKAMGKKDQGQDRS